MTDPPRNEAASVPARPQRRNLGDSRTMMRLLEKVRPGGDAGLVRPTYPELALGGTTLGATT
jgi:hypothetical protein